MTKFRSVLGPIILASLAAVGRDAAEPYNSVDAVTSASLCYYSGKEVPCLQIKSGKAYAQSVQITWWDYYNNGTQHIIRYGMTKSYGSQINLKPFTRQTDVTTTITGLTPGTFYYGQFYRTWAGVPYTTDFTFETPSASMVTVPMRASMPMVGMYQVDFYSVEGENLLSLFAQSNAASELKTKALRSGLRGGCCLVLVRDGKSSIASHCIKLPLTQ